MTQVICKNITCKKIIDEREKQIHIKIFHPNFRSLIKTTGIYPEIDQWLTPKDIVKKLFEVINDQ